MSEFKNISDADLIEKMTEARHLAHIAPKVTGIDYRKAFSDRAADYFRFREEAKRRGLVDGDKK